MHKFTHPNGSVLYIQRPREVADFVARHPRVLPQGPAEAPGQSWGLIRAVLVLFFFMAIAVAFFLVGEERPDSVVRPALTARQRAAAFR